MSSIKQAQAKLDEARDTLRSTQSAFTGAKRKVGELELKQKAEESSLAELQSAILMGTATEEQGNAAVDALQVVTRKVSATKSGMTGMQARLAADEAAVAQANRAYAEAIVVAARPVVAALQATTKTLFDAAFRSQADLLNLGASLAALDENVSSPVDANSFATTDLAELITQSAAAAGLRREAEHLSARESFVRIGYGAKFNASEIVALLQQQ